MSRGGGNKDDNKKQGDKNLNLLDIRYLLETVVRGVHTQVNKVTTGPLDGLPLYLHYRCTVWAMFGGFLAVFHSWYHKDNIVCVSHFNAETTVREEYVNVCLSYPFLQLDGKRRYILFYRWVHWSFLLLAVLFYLPRKVSKNLDNARCKKLLEDLNKEAATYEEEESKVVDKVYRYMVFNIRTHDDVYLKYILVNAIAVGVDICTFVFLNFVLQGRFILYGYRSFPFDRDPENFTDFMSQTFPPFVSCELTVANQLVNRRTEMFGCHLIFMELYEKIFMGLWLWLIVIMSLTICQIIFLLLLQVPSVRLLLLRFSKPVHATTKRSLVIENVARNSRVGDVYVLYRLGQYLSHARFWDVMVRLENSQACNWRKSEESNKDRIKNEESNKERIKNEESNKARNFTSTENQEQKTQKVKGRSKPHKDTIVTFPEDSPLLKNAKD